jgi:hypothetical protein
MDTSVAPDTKAKQQPVDLMGKLFGRSHETYPDATSLLTADPPIGFPETKQNLRHDLGSDPISEERSRELLLPGQMTVDTRPSSKFQHTVPFAGTMRDMKGDPSPGNFTTEIRHDPGDVLVKSFGGVEELDWGFATYISVTGQVADKTSVVWRNRLLVAERAHPPGTRHLIAGF